MTKKQLMKLYKGGDKMKEYFCPKCFKKLDVIDGWGSISYYCMECNSLVSSKRILTKEELEKIKNEEKED